MDSRDICTSPGHRFRSNLKGSAVGAIHNDGQSVECNINGADEELRVTRGRRRVSGDPADVGPHRPVPLFAHPLLDRIFDVVGEFVTASRKEFDPVVGHRIMRRREHHTEIGIKFSREPGDRGRWQYSGDRDIHTSACQTGHDRSLEKFSAGPGISSNYGAGAVSGESTSVTENVRGRHREIHGKFGRDVAVGEATYPVCAEESAHRWSL